MSRLEEFLKENPSMDESQYLSDESQGQLDGGACASSCRKGCVNGCLLSNLNGGSGLPGQPCPRVYQLTIN